MQNLLFRTFCTIRRRETVSFDFFLRLLTQLQNELFIKGNHLSRIGFRYLLLLPSTSSFSGPLFTGSFVASVLWPTKYYSKHKKWHTSMEEMLSKCNIFSQTHTKSCRNWLIRSETTRLKTVKALPPKSRPLYSE